MKNILFLIVLINSLLANTTHKDYSLVVTYTSQNVKGNEKFEFFGTKDEYSSYLTAISDGLFLGVQNIFKSAADTMGNITGNALQSGLIGLGGGLIIGAVKDYKERQKYPLEYLYITSITDDNGNILSKKIVLFSTQEKEKYNDKDIVKSLIEKELI